MDSAQINCPATSSHSDVLVWAGVGGTSRADGQSLLQNGVRGLCDKGAAGWVAFFETNPDNSNCLVHLTETHYPVKAGTSSRHRRRYSHP